MIEQVQRWRLNDGSLYSERDEAEAKLVEKIQNDLGALLDVNLSELAEKDRLTFKAKLAIIDALAGDLSKASQLKSVLVLWMD